MQAVKTRRHFFDLLTNGADLGQLLKQTNLDEKIFLKWLIDFEKANPIYQRIYCSDGRILLHQSDKMPTPGIVNLRISPRKETFRAVVIADTHYQSPYENPYYVHALQSHITQKDINTIFHCGDICGGYHFPTSNYAKDEALADYILEKYPRFEKANTFFVLGNHDAQLISKGKFNIASYLQENRLDLIPIAYQTATIEARKSKIILYHKIVKDVDEPYILQQRNIDLVLSGHYHRFLISSLNPLLLKIPTCSDMIYGKKDYHQPGFISMDLSFSKGHFQTGTFERYTFLDSEKACPTKKFAFTFDFESHKIMVKKEQGGIKKCR